MTLEQRLNDLIEERDSQIESLEERLTEEKDKLNLASNLWMVHRIEKPIECTSNLPLPRLEMRQSIEGYQTIFHYGIVYKHYSEMGDLITFIPLGKTTCTGTYKKQTPFREGVHIRHDSKALGMNAYLVDVDTNESYPIEECN